MATVPTIPLVLVLLVFCLPKDAAAGPLKLQINVTTGGKHCSARGGCTCDCGWANPQSCKGDDGSCCHGCCCGASPSPSPSPSPSGGGTASTTRYWDCSKPTCSWAQKCSGCGTPGRPYAADWNQLFKVNGQIYGTVATSGSLGQNAGGSGCNRCWSLRVKSGRAAGKTLKVMATNFCPDQPNCPRTKYDTNPWGQHYHFDIAIPGGGVGLADHCHQQYGGGSDWKVNSAAECSKLPSNVQSGCRIWWDDLHGMDNPLVAFTEISCPAVLRSKCRL